MFARTRSVLASSNVRSFINKATPPKRGLSRSSDFRNHGAENMCTSFTGTAHAEIYRQFRPVYPVQVSETIVEYCRRTNQNLKSALDVACGSGQGTHQLCNYFQRVTGVDVSEAQIVQAQKAFIATHPQMTFLVAKAEELFFQGNDTLDLITIAQAIHWVDLDKFYEEVKRVLRPGGTLAVYGYGNVKLDNEEATTIVSQLYKEVRTYFDDGRTHIDDEYAAFTPLPFDDFKRNDELSITKAMTLDKFIAYISTWSAYQKYIGLYPDSQLLEKYQARILEVYNGGKTPEDVEVVATWPLFLLLGRKTR